MLFYTADLRTVRTVERNRYRPVPVAHPFRRGRLRMWWSARRPSVAPRSAPCPTC